MDFLGTHFSLSIVTLDFLGIHYSLSIVTLDFLGIHYSLSIVTLVEVLYYTELVIQMHMNLPVIDFHSLYTSGICARNLRTALFWCSVSKANTTIVYALCGITDKKYIQPGT